MNTDISFEIKINPNQMYLEEFFAESSEEPYYDPEDIEIEESESLWQF
jgi:hypothetical protein